MSMEGVLLKWTNYVSGWQQRYFTLKDGVLSYYRSKEEINSGCKGSVKLSVCDVIVHSTDPRRFDLILGEQRFYLRALTQAERQRWVIALGSCKAGGGNSVSLDEMPDEKLDTQAIISHQSELRLYHNLMVQQVKELQTCLKENEKPDMARVNELTSTLDAACSTFLITLNELLCLTHSQVPGVVDPVDSSRISRPRTDAMPMHYGSLTGLNSLGSPSLGRSLPNVKNGGVNSWFPGGSPLLIPTRNGLRGSYWSLRKYPTFFSTMEFSFENLRPTMEENDNPTEGLRLPGDYLSASDFLKACCSLFTIFDRLTQTPLPPNLDSSSPRSFTALQQVQSDVMGNVERIRLAVDLQSKRLDSEPHPATDKPVNGDSSPTATEGDSSTVAKKPVISIGTLVRCDVANGSTKDDGSVYMAILWLSRALNFVREFLHLLFTLPPPADPSLFRGRLPPDDSLSVAATEAYTRCLRSFHNWSVRGAAMIVIKSLPTRIQFLHTLLADGLSQNSSAPPDSPSPPAPQPSSTPACQPELYSELQRDAKRYAESIGRTLTLIEGLLASLDLERVFTGSETY
ncbi:unnamed protein product [Calicophoron daubneyi]|uniref:Pleckstrin homology domain-containing family A member 8 n=1 Tax=Calicophoron daubneyi TaxID=300641 RepID=A0AAV2SXN0_CALDB